MVGNEIKTLIKTVYGMLWDVLVLYEKTDCYNKIPESEKEVDIWDYMDDKLLEVRKTINMIFLGEEETRLKNKGFVVFLDVDGVLNTRTTVQRTPDGYTGIDSARVEILAKVIQKMGGGDIVLSSDWKKMKSSADDYTYLVSKLEQWGLTISAHTKDQTYTARGAGILAYLKEHPEIMEYVILDDHKFDFENYKKLWERLLITDGIERAKFAARTPAVETILFLDYIKEF